MKKNIAAIIFLLSLAGAAYAGEVPDVFPRGPFPGPLELLDVGVLSAPDEHLAVIVQGMVNRQQPRIYLTDDASPLGGSTIWLSYYRTEYGIQTAGAITLPKALAKYGHRFKGYALFSYEESWTVNVADVYCSIHDCLPVTAEQEPIAVGLGLAKTEDFRGRWNEAEPAVLWSFQELFPQCSQKVVAAMRTGAQRPRDYFYAHRIFCFHFVPRGRELIQLYHFLARLPANIPVMGYFARTGSEELSAEIALARTSKFLFPSDSVLNLTVHSGIPLAPLPLKEVEVQPPDLRGKLGVVLAFTDGDNIINQAAVYVQPDHWLHPRRGEIKVAWSVSPMLYQLAPGVARYYYRTKSENDVFVPFGGAGYAFPSIYKDPEVFGRLTLDYMALGGLDTIWTIDANFYVAPIGDNVKKLFDPFMPGGVVKGALFGYLPSGGLRHWQGVAGYPPLLYSKVSYLTTDPARIAGQLRREAFAVPPRGKVVFFGLNNWKIHYEQVLQIADLLQDRPEIVFITPQEAFAAVNSWRKK
jgi:hypothetical protein